MKNEFDNNLTETFETDDLGIKASLEGVEPMEGARERMLQNIMKKAAAVQAEAQPAEGVKAASEETPKAEIFSIGAAKETAKKNFAKKQKNRWKLYVPMLAAAAVILTIGTIFFATIGMEKLTGGNSAAGNEKAYEDGNHKAPQDTEPNQDAKGGWEADTNDAMRTDASMAEASTGAPTDAASDRTGAPTDAATPVITGRPTGSAEPEVVDAPEFTMHPDSEFYHEVKTPGETQNDSGMALNPTAAPTDAPTAASTGVPATEAPVSEDADGDDPKTESSAHSGEPDVKTNPREAASPNGWSRLTPARKSLSDAAKGLEIVKFSAEDSKEDYVTLSYEDHEYVLLYVENGRTELELEEGFRSETVKTEEADNLTIQKLTKKGSRIWWAEWSLNGTDWFFLKNTDGAKQKNLEALIQVLEKNSWAAAQ